MVFKYSAAFNRGQKLHLAMELCFKCLDVRSIAVALLVSLENCF